MEIGIDRVSSLEKSFTSKRLSLDNQQTSNKRVLDIKLESQANHLVDFNSCNDQDDEGEIMLLAMILLQLHGVNLPSTPSSARVEDDNSDSQNKKKRQRTSPDQLLILEEIFETDRMPNPQTRGQLADQLGMSSRRVQIWFQNKRAKVKREVTGAKPDGYCSSPSQESSCSFSPSSSPSSPCVPSNESSPLSSPSHGIAVVPQINLSKPTSSSIIIPPAVSKSFLPSTSTVPSTSTIIDNTTKQLKAQQQQFSRTAPFVETQPVLTASY